MSLANHLTLKQVRENCKKSIEQVSDETGISVAKLKRWEKDASRAETYEFFRLLQYYKISFNHVHAGKAEDVYKARREAVSV
ncbi:helix-turn-helix domain-containing protein [Paenibacillus ottowii]|uniref:Helix-turn-helix transcriptional regulator n=1 Tax=Paenibacillus ottowii TaxID=2315729 RepID=A0ABY3BC82_9BACL|nr:helix-turn-helix transcriptional regulator [Paenibacillus ottowii]TQS01402.1 helix-turn-helix transcriptional regulator [Paenibacillus ottowii]TQS01457.1 helix-turn-helix transcriptional regulator [Paenibacillus ottowii]